MKFIISKTVLTACALTAAFQVNAQQKTPGINTSLMDKNVSPKDNFFQFVNGTWLKNTEIPADKTRWGSFDELRQNTDKDALDILKEAANNPKYSPNTDQGKAISMYKSAMDTVARNRQGINPIKAYLAKIDEVKNIKDLQRLLMEEEAKGGGAGFFGFGIGADDKNSKKNSVSLGVGGLGLPDKDYYISEDKDSKEKREKYQAHVARMLAFIGKSPAQAKADAEKVLALETAMSRPRLDRLKEGIQRSNTIRRLLPICRKWRQSLTGKAI
jgi:predicted metalloendopeptidase